jgi:lysophospholipase L1-like esterase
MIAQVTLPGDAIRVRLDNTFGAAPVTFEKASVGPRVLAATIARGLMRPVTFGGSPSVTIPAGGSVESDPVALHVDALQDVAVSLYISGEAYPSQHKNAYVTSYLTENGAGDATESVDGKPFTGRTTSMFWLKAIDVQAQKASAIVILGDSMSDATCATLDANNRWEDLVAKRLVLGNIRRSVVNEGIGGNTIASAANYEPTVNPSPAGTERLERDVLSHPGVSHLLLFLGTNDIRRGASADVVISGLKNAIQAARAKGIKVVGVTLLPRHSSGWTDEHSRVRIQVNTWIRKDAGFDDVLDLERVVRSAENPDFLNPAFDCVDGEHPTPSGQFQMGRSVDLTMFGKK